MNTSKNQLSEEKLLTSISRSKEKNKKKVTQKISQRKMKIKF